MLKRTDSLSNTKFAGSVSLVSWAYNEEESIGLFIERIQSLLEQNIEDFEILIVDDGSTDSTAEIICRYMSTNPKIRMLQNGKNINIGLSCRKAIGEASKEFVFWQTVDWSYDIDQLRLFLELLNKYDVVAGIRLEPVNIPKSKIPKFVLLLARLFAIKHITKRSDSIKKAFISIINYWLIRTLFRIPLSDYQNVVFYRTSLIQSHKPEAISSFLNPEYLFKSYWKGASIVEVPISFIPRIKGEAKGTRFGAILAAIKDIFRLWIKWIVFNKIDRSNAGQIHRLDEETANKFIKDLPKLS